MQTVLRGTSQKVSDGAALRFILEEFESKVNTFRSTMKSNISLIESEADQLQTEVDTTSRIIAEWNEHDENIEHLNGQDSNKSVGSNSNKKKNKNKSDINITTDKSTIVDLTRRTLDHQNKLRIIEKQLSHLGGPNGGWHYQDHDMFLRVWTQTQTVPVVVISQHQHQHQQQNSIYRSNRADQNNNENRGQINEYNNDIHSLKSVVNFDIHGNQNESIASAGIQIPVMSIPSPQFNRLLFKLTPLLPQKADQELEAHVIWYLQYLSLCHAKKELIASWKRTRKNQSKNDDIYLDSDLVISIGGTHTAKSMILNDNTGYSGEASEWLPRPQMNELNRNEVKERIAEWRQRKVAVAAQNQFREKEQAEHEIKIEAQRVSF